MIGKTLGCCQIGEKSFSVQNQRHRVELHRRIVKHSELFFRFLILLTLVIGLPLITGGQTQLQPNKSRNSKTLSTSTRAVVLTTDCGVEMDDQWALAHLLLSREFDLRAVITTHASSIGFSSATSAKKATEVIAHVLPSETSSLPPVMSGSDSPLQNATTPRENAGVDFLLGLSRSFSASRRLIVFIIGAGTDVASAILKDPTFVNRVSVVAMGFNDWPAGGDGFNVKNDPLAWQVILDSEVPVVVGSDAVTRRGLRLTRAEAAALMRPRGSVGEYLYAILDDFLKKYESIVAQFVAPETWVVWDEVVVAYALGMARGNEVPRPKLQSDLSFSHPETNKRITWLTEIDTERVWLDFTQKIDTRGLSK
jgi:inosine-uridine nucleoside N-ribohydrolase